jgi:hypothetical protein
MSSTAATGGRRSILRSLISNKDGSFCARRIGFYFFGITAIVGFFMGLNEILCGSFLAAAMGKSYMIGTQKE